MVAQIKKIAICDDDFEFADLLKKRVENYFIADNRFFQFYVFSNGTQILSRLSENFDLVFMDIEMQGLSGLQTVEEIRKRNNECTIIFISTYAAYACQGYRYKAIRYLLKNKLAEDLEECLDAVFGQASDTLDNEVILDFRAENEVVLLKASDILYFESTLRRVKVFVTEKPYCYEYYEKLDALSEKLQEKGFVRCHQSFLVNASCVLRLIGTELLLSTGKKIPVSRSRYSEVKRRLAFYWGS